MTRLKALAGIVAPTTLVTALLFYFGYVATVARFRYFGVYLDLVGLSTQQMLLYGVEVAYVPLTVIALTTVAAVVIHGLVHLLIARSDRATTARWLGLAVSALAVLLLIRALIGIVVPAVSATETPGVTPLSLTFGAIFVSYAGWLLRVRAESSSKASAARIDVPGERVLVRLALVALAGLVVAGLFWAANSFAAGYGVGRALDDTAKAPNDPEVILDTDERLDDLPAEVAATEQPLPDADGRHFHYRYRGLRLLVASGDLLFLIPAQWSEQSGRTIVVRRDSTVRIQLDP